MISFKLRDSVFKDCLNSFTEELSSAFSKSVIWSNELLENDSYDVNNSEILFLMLLHALSSKNPTLSCFLMEQLQKSSLYTSGRLYQTKYLIPTEVLKAAYDFAVHLKESRLIPVPASILLLLNSIYEDLSAKKMLQAQLISGVKANNLDAVDIAVSNGADVNDISDEGTAPLHVAAQNGFTEVVKTLLSTGAEIDILDSCGERTPLLIAAREGYVEVVDALLSAGADVNLKTEWDWSALLSAAAWGREDVVSLLLERGAEADDVDFGGWTPLHWAASKDHLGTTQILIKHGASTKSCNNGDNKTPRDLAEDRNSCSSVAEYLRSIECEK